MKPPKEMSSEELMVALEHVKPLEKFIEGVKEEFKLRLKKCEIIQKYYKLTRGGARTYYGKGIPNQEAKEIFDMLNNEKFPLANFVEFKNHKDMPEHIKEVVEKFPHTVEVSPSIGKNKAHKEGGLEHLEEFPWE